MSWKFKRDHDSYAGRSKRAELGYNETEQPSNGVNHSIQLSRIVNWTPQVQKLCVHWTLTSFISASSCYFVCVRGRTVFHFSASKPQIWGSGTPGRCLTEPLILHRLPDVDHNGRHRRGRPAGQIVLPTDDARPAHLHHR